MIERLERIGAELPKADGVGRFNDLYLAMTREIEGGVRNARFEDQDFLTRLDVVFANYYFAAVEASKQRQDIAPAWAPLFEARTHPRIAAIQFALAGVNAHINYDLGVALVATCSELEIALELDSPQHRDYLRVNEIIARVEDNVKKSLETTLIDAADEALGRLDDVLAMWSVYRARDAAWTHAEVLWKLRDISALENEYSATIARMVGLAARGLLVPVL